MLTMSKSIADSESESVVVDACILANKLYEQQDKYDALYKTYKEIKDNNITFDYCPDAKEKYADATLSLQSTINGMKEDLDGLEYLIKQSAEEAACNKLNDMEQDRLHSYLRDIETYNKELLKLDNDLKDIPYLKDTYNIQEQIPKFKKELSMNFQVKVSNLNFKSECDKANKRMERVKKQRAYTHMDDFIQDTIHDRLEANTQSIIKRETAVINQANKQKIPTVTSTNKTQKESVKKNADKTAIKNKIQKMSQEMDQHLQPMTLALDTERISNSLGQITSVIKNHEQVLNFIYDPFEEKKIDNINNLDPIYALQSIDTVKNAPCLTEALAAAIVKMTENRFSEYNRQIETLNREIDGLDNM